MYKSLKFFLEEELESVKEAGLFKRERVITSPQGAQVHVENTDEVVIMCANNYLGLSSHPWLTIMFSRYSLATPAKLSWGDPY
mgnify:CR=1 FL=1